MTEAEIHHLAPSDAGRLLELRYKGMFRTKLRDHEIEGMLPEEEEVQGEIRHNRSQYLGAYTASRLVAYAEVGTWTSENDELYLGMGNSNGWLRGTFQQVFERRILKDPVGVHQLEVADQLNHTERYLVLNALIGNITTLADAFDSAIHIAVLEPETHPAVGHLELTDFKDTSFRNTGRDLDGKMILGKYIRPSLSSRRKDGPLVRRNT